MPLNVIDYSKTVMYKIQHNDDETLLYVGSTTNFNNRKSQHKHACVNETNKKYNLKVYRMIRDNGGWDCFSMTKIEDFPCENGRDAEAREDKLMRELKANMNGQRAFIENPATERLIYDRRYRETHQEQIRQYRETHREQRLASQRRWRQNNPNYDRERRARIKREAAAAEEQ
jgi:hypothetical protein